jgi:hypothetical protein
MGARRFPCAQFFHVIGHSMKFLCPDDQIDVRQPFQQVATACLSHATKEPEHHMWPLFRHPSQHSHFPQRFLIRHVAHAASVQEHDVSFRFVCDALVAARQ